MNDQLKHARHKTNKHTWDSIPTQQKTPTQIFQDKSALLANDNSYYSQSSQLDANKILRASLDVKSRVEERQFDARLRIASCSEVFAQPRFARSKLGLK